MRRAVKNSKFTGYGSIFFFQKYIINYSSINDARLFFVRRAEFWKEKWESR